MSDEIRSKFMRAVVDDAWEDSGCYGEPDKHFLAGFQAGVRLNGGRIFDLIDRLADRIEELEAVEKGAQR